MNSDYFVYVYYHPTTLEPFYVGKGRRNRHLIHVETLDESKFCNKFFFRTIAKIRKELAKEPIIEKYKENLTNIEACSLEKELIKKFGRRDLKHGTLVNLTDGGEGTEGRIYSTETRIKIGQSVLNNRSREKHSEGCRRGQTGRKHAAAVKEKIRNSWTEEKRNEQSLKQQGSKNAKALTWVLYSPDGREYIIEDMYNWCLENNHSYTAFRKRGCYGENHEPIIRGPSKGWSVKCRYKGVTNGRTTKIVSY